MNTAQSALHITYLIWEGGCRFCKHCRGNLTTKGEMISVPHISIQFAQGHTIEQKQAFIGAITSEAVRILNVKKEWVTIVFDEYDRGN